MIQHLVGLSHWQIDLLVVYLFIQGAFFTVFPEEIVLPTLGVLWGQGRIGFFEAFLAAMLGLCCGDLILVLLGRAFGMDILSRRPFAWVIKKRALDRAMKHVRAYGAWLIFLVRFTPTVRAPMFFAAGISKMPIRIFLRSNLLGMVLWIPLLMLFGRKLGAAGSIDQAFHRLGLIMFGLLLSALLYAIYEDRRDKRRESA